MGGRRLDGRGLPGRGQGSEGGGVAKMAASMCDVFSFCVGVAGGARGSVEVRFVSSAKVRPDGIPLGETPRGPVPTTWSSARSAPAWPLLGPGRRVCPRSQARGDFSRGKLTLGACVLTPPSGTRPTGSWRCCDVLGGVEALGSPGVGTISWTRLGSSWLGVGLSLLIRRQWVGSA